MEGDYNVLIPLQSARALNGSFLQEVVTADVLIGTANSYLYRIILGERGTIQELGTKRSAKTPILSNIVYNYSAFDQPVTITAPADAVPADTTTPAPNPTNPLASIAQLSGLGPADGYSVKALERIFAPGFVAAP